MKKILLVISALLLVASAVPARAAAPGAFVAADQFAEADWIIMHGPTKASMYFALGWRVASVDGLQTIGAVGKGTCRVEKTRHMTMVICQATGRAKELSMDEFEFDPALRSASMSFDQRGYKQKVKWRGRGRLPWVGGQVVGGEDYVATGAMMDREARADARIFGHRVRARGGWISFAFLGQGATAAAFTGYGRSVTLRDDGSFTYRVKVRAPR